MRREEGGKLVMSLQGCSSWPAIVQYVSACKSANFQGVFDEQRAFRLRASVGEYDRV